MPSAHSLLLDALAIVAPSQPTLAQFLLPPPSSQSPKEANGHMLHQSLTAQDPLNGDAPRPRNAEVCALDFSGGLELR